MKVTLYPTLQEALELHRYLLDRFGGAGGVRDLGLLESALARPRSGYYKTLHEQAAALMQSLTMNHAFVDGNKRVAFALSAIFLRINGYRLIVDPDNGEHFIRERLINAKVELKEITEWLLKHSTKV